MSRADDMFHLGDLLPSGDARASVFLVRERILPV
jgi:hypothetical protein